MYALRLSASRLATSRMPPHSGGLISTCSSRPLSTQTNQAVDKLRSVLEDYRQQHYTQEIPSRFKKEIVRAASQSPRTTMHMQNNKTSQQQQQSSVVAMDGLCRVLFNIGAQDRLAMTELQTIFKEVGDEGGQIPAQRFYQIL